MEHPLFGVEGAVQVPVSSLNFHDWRLKHENNDNLFTSQFHEKKNPENLKDLTNLQWVQKSKSYIVVDSC